MKISGIGTLAGFMGTKLSGANRKAPTLNYEIKDTISFGSKISEKTSPMQANYPDMLAAVNTRRTRTISEVKEALRRGEDISQDRDRLILSRLPRALRDAKEFAAEHPEFDPEDIGQDLIRIVIEKTDRELEMESESSTFGVLYARTRGLYFDKILKQENKMQGISHDIETIKQPHEIVEEEDFKKAMDGALRTLSKKEQFVLKSLYGFGGIEERSRAEVADDLNLTVERVRQIREKGLKKLAHPSRYKAIKDYRLK